ncbi:BTB/POZ domain-containing protein [Rhizophagus irregularis DAOM 181602=DAOM 197198]|nr:BTB/POZ domain-containing protein [Rhizophagus irregularis DAOM 181602=DAOM 197198]
MNRTLSIDFLNLLQDPIDYNAKIIVGKEQNIKEFNLHSAILASRSNYFKNALSLRWAKKENGIIIFKKPNISPLVFQVLIKYIYSGIISIENNEIGLIIDVIIAADELELLELYQQLEEVLLGNILEWKTKDIIKILRCDNFVNLYKAAINLVCNNPGVIFESDDFLKMEETYLIQLLKCDYLKLEEIKIWEYLIKWGIKNTNSILNNDIKTWKPLNFIDLKKTLQNCIPHIRFFQMSPDEYTKIRTDFKNILPDDLDDEVTQYFSNSASRLSFNALPPRYIFDSKIINATDVALIASWIDKKNGTPHHFNDLPFKFNLIYRASRDGFGTDKFHKHCDNKGPTILLIKVRHPREIIGGYNPLEWCRTKMVEDERSHNHKNYQCETSNSFLFSLTSRFNPILSRVNFEKEAIIWSKNEGPYFGLQDLYIKSSGSFINNIVGYP